MTTTGSGLPRTTLAEADLAVEEPTGVVTIPDVELVASGSWLAAAGDGTLTEDDLDAMVEAAGDPDIDAAALRIGHFDPRFDGEPALGWIENVRKVGNKLVGDLVGVPAKLAEVIPTAFRRRSVEMLGSADVPVTTAAGKSYRRVLSGLALLGVQRPAVKGLGDVLALYADGPGKPAGVTTVLAEVSLDDVRRGAVEAVTGVGSAGFGGEVSEGWVTELYTDAAVVEHYDPSGGRARYFRVPYLIDNVTGAVTYGEPVEVRQTWVPVAAASGAPGDVIAAAAILDAVRATPTPIPGGDTPHAPRPTTFAHAAPAPCQPSPDAQATNRGDTVASIDDARIRELLGIEADADIEAALKGLKPADAATATQTDAAAAASAADAADAPATPPVTPPAAPATPSPELVTLSEGAHGELVAQAAAGAEALRILREQEAREVVRTALREGRIAPTEVELFTTRAVANLDDTKALLGGLSPRFPTTELGDAAAPASEAAEKAWDDFAVGLGVDPK